MRPRFVVLAALAVGALATPGTAAAHPHAATHAHQGSGQVLANGANHGPGLPVGSPIMFCGGDSAVYGLETAHHGPDAGTPGKADGECFQLDSWPPTSDVSNPAIG